MGFMSRKKNTPAEGAYITVISQGTKLVGELTLDAKLHIDGVFEGTIVSTSEVSIGASGFVKGTLTAQKILVSGFAQGDIDCECLEVIGSGKVFGEITCVDLVIEPGGRFVGTSHIKDPAGEPAALPDRHQAAQVAVDKPAEKVEKAEPAAKAEPAVDTKSANEPAAKTPPETKPQAAGDATSRWSEVNRPAAATAGGDYAEPQFRQDQSRVRTAD